MDTGMIIIGFPGIGKSSVASSTTDIHTYYHYVDLESSCYNLTNPDTGKIEKCKDWEKFYITVAYHLAKQGKYVFVSNHPAVIKEIITRRHVDSTLDKIPVLFVYPSIRLKGKWIERLQNRYSFSLKYLPNEAEKNEAALNGIVSHYDEWISDLDNRDVSDVSHYGNNVFKIPLHSTAYQLEKVIEKFIKDYTYLQKCIVDLENLQNGFNATYKYTKKNEEDK
nr:MAG TPA: P-loop Nucleotide Kinase3 [Bacteriophage sp.]